LIDSFVSSKNLREDGVSEYDIIGVVETWLTEDIRDAEIKINGYEFYRKDRRIGKGGGIILYVKESLHSELCIDLMHLDFEESLWCKVQSHKGDGQLLGGVCYRCPRVWKTTQSCWSY